MHYGNPVALHRDEKKHQIRFTPDDHRALLHTIGRLHDLLIHFDHSI
jgi:hypothetical protein